MGAILPNSGPIPLSVGVDKMASALIAAGASGLWISDHLVLEDGPSKDYPYAPDGRITWSSRDDYLECLTTCAFIAALLDGDCTVGTAILVLPQRNVLQTAKELATLDRLSGGRLRIGLGAGWNREEMEALGYAFASRGKRFDEMLDVLRDAWSGRTTGFSGSEVTVPRGLILSPRPSRPEGPPLLVGGMSVPAIRRAARLGDGWLALAFVDRWDSDALAAAAGSFRRQWREHRQDTPPYMVLKLHCPAERCADLLDHVQEAATLGFDEVAIELPWALGIEKALGVFTTVAGAHG
ncbi:TIGR03619 family F420-dependent LLM class oxidoreductase [Nocardioides cavernae]|uniref:TIGR03619 family F420-dependent LLM class oxidoreductase n=1 Tax=Nocardioides cavernae TaxID=1921566 RepID=A0ABR8NCR4_9ACTN|nr:TIGR03619 family F420-dependent LLM class oxidoreductase [Nocardioides cavernae]MBD3924259.1 TIGR03619 family F420-dependent LLM class oxidoreductase [Nocardioides cavernae]MBM7510802.1 putative F420-dependent oxidoreductase [Nocardioides cavernae]